MQIAKAKLPADLFGIDPEMQQYYLGGYQAFASPNRQYNIIFGPGYEYAMMHCLHCVALTDKKFKPTPAFHTLQSPFPHADWSPDSKVVALPLAVPSDVLLLYRPAEHTYAIVNANAYQLSVRLRRDRVELKPDRDEFRAYFGRKFAPPRPSVLKYKDLVWKKSPASGICLNKAALRRAPRPKWKPPPSKALLAFAKKHGISINLK